MLNKLRRVTSTFFPVAVVIAIAVFVSVRNYQPGTYLSGWDTLHPEFNLQLYAHRVFFGAWQEHQGLGAPASQAHLAELPRLPLLWLLNTILPESAVRYVFFFLMYILGGISTYIFIRSSWFKSRKGSVYSWAAMIGSLFYLLNLGTLQQFYVPLEMFAVHFATFGLVLWSTAKCLKSPQLKNFFFFFLIQIFSAPSAHTATLFYAYMFVTGLYAVSIALLEYKKKPVQGFQNLLLLLVLIISAHFYWLAPNLYYILIHSDYVSLAKISRNFSPEAFWQNQAFGQVWNVIIIKNFLFNWQDFSFKSHSFVDLFNEWRPHLSRGLGYVFLYVISLLSLAGIPLSFSKIRASQLLGMLVLFFTSFFFLVNLNFPFSPLYHLLLHNELLHEALRFPFTKFSIIFIFSLSVFLAQTTAYLLNYCSQNLQGGLKKVLPITLVATAVVIILYASKPALEGNLISPNMKVTFPAAYSELYSWLDKQPSQQRIAKLPLTTYWGWVYQDWPAESGSGGYQGAGFTWFGIPQPTMDREFDRWVNKNEFFYRQLSTATLNKDRQAYLSTLEQYDISYLLLDESSLSTNRTNQNEAVEETKQWLETLPITKVWHQDFLSVYRLDFAQNRSDSFLEAPANYTRVLSESTQRSSDPVYLNVGSYIAEPGLWYPFAGLQAEQPDLAYTSDSIIFTAHLSQPLESDRYILETPSTTQPHTLPVKMTYTGDQLTLQIGVKTSLLDNQEIAWQAPEPRLITLATGITAETLIVDVGGGQVSLIRGETITTGATLSESGSLLIQAFDSKNVVANNNQLAVDSSNVFSQTVYLPRYGVTGSVLVDENSQWQLQVAKQPTIISLSENEAFNCSNPRQGKVVNEYSNPGKATYLANNLGVNCDSVSLPLSSSQSFILRLKGSNTQGRSLKIFLTDNNKGDTIFEELLPEGAFDVSYSINTPARPDASYRLNWETRSFGQVSENSLEAVELYFLPLDLFSQLTLVPSQPAKFSNEVDISHVWKFGSHQYGASITGHNTDNLVVLSQSFDSAWIAFDLKNPLKPFTHTLYNGWANAWLLPVGQHQVIFLYLPQLVSFFGLFLLAITLVFFGVFLRLVKSTSK